MKRANLWPMLLAVVTLAACEKAGVRPSEPKEINSAKKPGGGGGGTTAVVSFGGQSSGVNATIWNTASPTVTSNQTILAQTKMLLATGGTESASVAGASIPGALTADLLQSSTTGQGNATSSQSSATNVSITVGGHVITASLLQSSANASCGPVLTGNVRIENLVLNGVPVTVTGAVNQSIYLSNGGLIIINEQSVSKKGKQGSIQVAALHIILPQSADIRVATSRAEIKC